MTENLILVATGFVASVIGSIIGAGGGFLVIPFLLLAKDFNPQLAVGTSLSMVFISALSSTYVYAKLKRIDYSTAWKFAAATIPGSIAGAYASNFWGGQSFRIAFGLFIASVAAQILYRTWWQSETAAAKDSRAKDVPTRIITDSHGNCYTICYNVRAGVLASFGVGFLASILGIGGGLIHVPLMIYILAFPAHIATATSNLILTVSALFGSITHFQLGNIHLETTAFLALGAVIGAQFGARLSRSLKEQAIVRILALALLFLAFRLLFG